MKSFLTRYLSICPQSGKIRGFKNPNGLYKLLFPIIGIGAIIWIVIRVFPKPNRAEYPCMKVAAPIAGGFVVYLVGLIATLFTLKKATMHFKNYNYALASVFILASIIISSFTILKNQKDSYGKLLLATDSLFVPTDNPNSPMGIAEGIIPGRVVWMYDPTATSWNGKNGYWWDESNTYQPSVDSMFAKSLRSLSGKTSDVEAWDAIFKYFNEQHGKGSVGYKAGEKIAIKINLNQVGDATNPGNKSFPSPQAVLALLRQLVNNAGVKAADITFYDSNRYVPDAIYNKCKNEFPDVHFIGWTQLNGREKYIRDNAQVKWSQNLTMETIGTTPSGYTAYIPTVVTQASYLISLANFKAHRYVGVTFCTKNHFGTISANGTDGKPYQNAPHAAGLHPYVSVHDIVIQGSPEWSFKGRKMGTYNALVDLMGHKDIGGKTLLFMIDALYGVQSEQDQVSLNSRWLSAPFNNNWTSSMFLSLDNVAIESVGLDFFRSEQAINPNITVVYGSVDNYLHEASQADNPPSKTEYDPEKDGIPLKSLGVHEHWNNATDKMYTRNLGTGYGIELVKLNRSTTVINKEIIPVEYSLQQNYPNPFNPSTIINFKIVKAGHVSLKIYDAAGREIATLVDEYKQPGEYNSEFGIENISNRNASGNLSSGVYFYILRAGGFVQTKKMLLIK